MPSQENQEHNHASRSAADQFPRPAAVAKALEIFNDSWSFAVLQELFYGVKRFDEFQRNLDISRSVLTRRLRHLEDKQIIIRKIYSSRPKRYEYKLTPRGLDMYPVFLLLLQWGEKWVVDEKNADILLQHKTCGHALEASLTCNSCGEEINVREVNYESAK